MRVTFHGMVQVRELERIPDEEHRCIVAHQVPVSFLGVELQREAADIALGIGRAALAGHGGEAGEHLGLLADLAEDVPEGEENDDGTQTWTFTLKEGTAGLTGTGSSSGSS